MKTQQMKTGDPIAVKLMRKLVELAGKKIEKFDPEQVSKIQTAALVFFGANPKLNPNDHIDIITTAEYSVVHQNYGAMKGFADLHDALQDYYNSLK